MGVSSTFYVSKSTPAMLPQCYPRITDELFKINKKSADFQVFVFLLKLKLYFTKIDFGFNFLSQINQNANDYLALFHNSISFFSKRFFKIIHKSIDDYVAGFAIFLQ